MQVEQRVWTATRGWQGDASLGEEAQLVLWFGGPGALASLDVQGDLSAAYPNALIAGCSTGGEIAGDEVLDDSVVSVACRFEKVALAHAEATIAGPEQSEAVGEALGTGLPATVDGKGLKGTFVLADGTLTNGSALIKGFRDKIGEEVTLTGGLAGDGPNFQKTLVGCNAAPRQGGVVAIGFYGDAFRLGWGSFGGWETFGPERSVTKSKDNVLFELDGEPALGLYKRYLGEEAKGLPGSALLFPLTIRPADDAKATLVRTIVGVDEGSQSMTFAGD
ncbi:MAG: FIST signal transduction protein, partial [Rhodospirillales bacterium]